MWLMETSRKHLYWKLGFNDVLGVAALSVSGCCGMIIRSKIRVALCSNGLTAGQSLWRPPWNRYPLCSLWRIPCQRRWMCPEGSCDFWRTCWNWRVSYGGRSLREETLWTDHRFPNAFCGGGKRDGDERMKLSVEEWISWWKDVCFSQSTSILIGSKLNDSFPSWVCFDLMVTGKWYLHLYLDLWALLCLLFPLFCWGWGVTERLGRWLAIGQGQRAVSSAVLWHIYWNNSLLATSKKSGVKLFLCSGL